MQLGVKECLYTSPHIPPAKLESVLEKCGIPKTQKKQGFFEFVHNKKLGDFKIENIEQDLGRLVGDVKTILNELELKTAMRAASCLINYLEVHELVVI